MQRAVAPLLALAAAVLAACGGQAGDRAAGSRQPPAAPPSAPTLTCAEGGGAAPNRRDEPTGYVELDPRRDVVAGPLSFVGAKDRAQSPVSDYEPIGLGRLQHGWPGLAPDDIPPRVRERMRERSLYSADEMAFVVRGDRAVTIEIPEPERAHASLIFDKIRFRWQGEEAEFVERFGLAVVSDGRPAVRVEPCGAGPTLFGRGFVVAGARCLPLNVWVEGEAEPIRTLISFAAGRCGEAESAPGWTTYRSAKWGYTVSFPGRWHRAEESLTPTLTDPREILSVGTFPLRHRTSECGHVPRSALEDMTATDVLLTIQERGLDPHSDWQDFPPRPPHFRFVPGHGSEAPYCVRGPVRFVDHWFGFTDAGRHFHVEVALGKSAPEELRREAYRILDSLRFDPAVTPDWRSSG